MERNLLLREVNEVRQPGRDYFSGLSPVLMVKIGQLPTLFKGITNAFTALLAGGEKRENFLTDHIFFERHPNRNGRKLRKSEKTLIREWLSIRNNVVRPTLTYLYGGGTNLASLNGEQLLEDIFRFMDTWIDAYLGALDIFKLITERATQADFDKLKIISGQFLFEVSRNLIDSITDFAGDVPIVGPIVKGVKAIGNIADIVQKYKDRQEQYKALVDKNQLIEFIASEKEFFLDLKTTLSISLRELMSLFGPMINKDKPTRTKVEALYIKSKARLVGSSQEVLFRQIAEKWSQKFPEHMLRVVLNKDMKVLTLTLNVPFGGQILDHLRHSVGGLNLQTIRLKRHLTFFPINERLPSGFAEEGGWIRYIYERDIANNKLGSDLSARGGFAARIEPLLEPATNLQVLAFSSQLPVIR